MLPDSCGGKEGSSTLVGSALGWLRLHQPGAACLASYVAGWRHDASCCLTAYSAFLTALTFFCSRFSSLSAL